jgi:hypothetical protein
MPDFVIALFVVGHKYPTTTAAVFAIAVGKFALVDSGDGDLYEYILMLMM